MVVGCLSSAGDSATIPILRSRTSVTILNTLILFLHVTCVNTTTNANKYRCMLIEDTKVICLVLVSVLHEHRLIPHPKARTAIISERQDDIDHLYRESMSCCSPPWICSTRKIRLRRRQPPTTSDCPAPQVNKTRRIPPQNVQINGNWCYVAVQAQ